MKQYKAIILDIDGTLLDTYETNMIPLIRIIREELGQTWTLEQLRPFYWQTGLKTMRDLGFANPEAMYTRWVAAVNANEDKIKPFAGIHKVLEDLRAAGFRLAVVSSKMHEQYKIDMGGHGLDVFMETAVLVEDTVNHKPHPEPMLECLRRLQLQPEEALYVGDAINDSLAARNAGMDFGFATWSPVSPPEIPGAKYRFDSPEDMLRQLL
jgi:HAD superfamily hydrolase (TIGR01662 family)